MLTYDIVWSLFEQVTYELEEPLFSSKGVLIQ